jgi:hypothetical protein
MSDWLIKVVCTDRGRHKRARLCDVRKVTDHNGVVRRSMTGPVVSSGSWQFPDPAAEANAGPFSDSRSSYKFDCPRCSRHLSIDQKRWWDALKVVVTQTDATEIDISVLPF